MEEKFYSNLWRLFLDIKAKNTDEVLIADEPKRLLIGWAMPKLNKVYYVRLVDIRSQRAMHIPFDVDGADAARDKLKELILGQTGRLQIAKFLSHEEPIFEFSLIDRLINLKAFW